MRSGHARHGGHARARHALCAAVLLPLLGAPAAAEAPRPRALEGVRVEERIGDKVPLELWFSDTTGRRIQLGALFRDGKPVLLVLAYVRCKMLCSLVLQGTTEAVRTLPLELGRDYRVVMVSIDPAEEAASAEAKRRELLRRSGRPENQPGWSYLVGAERPIRALAEALGFHYAWDPRSEQFAHPAVVFVLAPDGTIARYFHGVAFSPIELAASLRAAAAGQLGGASLAETVLSCFRFDPAARAQRDNINLYLRVGGAVLVLVLLSTIVSLFLWERRRRAHE